MKKQYGKRTDHTVIEIGKGAYLINEFGLSNSFLLIGEEKALVIDVATGFGDLLGVIRKYTDLPLIVVGTHAHPDHIGGRGQFEEVYIHKADLKLAKSVLNKNLARRVMMVGMLERKDFGIKQRDLTKPVFKTKFIPIEEGHVFDLGGRDVEVLSFPGHTKGSIALIDKQERLIFTGDNVNPMLLMFFPNVATMTDWLPGAKRLKALAEEYTSYNGHDKFVHTADQIEKIVTIGEQIIDKEGKNGLFPTIKSYPKGRDYPFKIVYRKNRIKPKGKA